MGSDDKLALGELNRAGDGRPRRFQHFMYIPDKTRGEDLATRLRSDGFEVETRMGADGRNWLLLVSHRMIPDEEAVERLGKQLSEFAKAIGGEYDGWEAEV